MGDQTAARTRVSAVTGVVELNAAKRLALDSEAVARSCVSQTMHSPRELAATEDDLEYRLGAISTAHAVADLDALALSARRIRHLAMQIGLLELRRAADNVLDCRTQGDATALAAVVARLDRLGRLALMQVAQMGRTVT